MAKIIYNHLSRIKSIQPARIKAIYPGTIIQFKYTGKNIFDKRPMVLVLWNNYTDYQVHGINLNYLSEYKIKVIMKQLLKDKENKLIVEDQDDSEYDDNLPYRNMLKDPYTRLKLPTYKENRSGNPLSKVEARKQMELLYERKLRRFVKKEDMYRSYNQNKIKELKAVTYDIEGLLK